MSKFFNIEAVADVTKNKFEKVASGFGLSAVKVRIFEQSGAANRSVEQSIGTSDLGNPVFDNIVFEEGSYKDEDGNIITYANGGFRIDTVIIDVSQTKNIITTPIQGRNGTVKEYIGLGDYVATVRGLIVGENEVHPEFSKRDLINILEVPKELKIASQTLESLGSYDWVVLRYDIQENEGQRNVVPFVIRLVSDTPFSVKITDDSP